MRSGPGLLFAVAMAMLLVTCGRAELPAVVARERALLIQDRGRLPVDRSSSLQIIETASHIDACCGIQCPASSSWTSSAFEEFNVKNSNLEYCE